MLECIENQTHVGRERDYVIYPDLGYCGCDCCYCCGCDDFFYAVMGGEAPACQHLIAQKLAESLECYDLMDEWTGFPNPNGEVDALSKKRLDTINGGE